MKNLLLILSFVYLFSLHAVESTDKFILITPPKCGTFLASRALYLMTGNYPFHYTDYHFTSLKDFEELLNDTEANQRFIRTHLPPDPELIQLLRERDYKVITIVRDPRDQLISALWWILSGKDRDFLFEIEPEQFEILSYEEQLEELITGERFHFPVTQKLFRLYYGWLESDEIDVLTVRFEDLVGAKGGGEDEKQIESLGEISRFIGLDLTPIQLQKRVGERLFGVGPTFRSGRVAQWRTEFTLQHNHLFEDRYEGDLRYLGYPLSRETE